MDQEQVISDDNLPSGNQNDIEPPPKEDQVQYSTYKRTVGQVKSLKSSNQELQAELDRLKTEKQAGEEAELEKQNDFKKLADLRQKEADDLKAKNLELSNTLVQGTKYQAFVDGLPGNLLHRDYMQMANVEDIVIDPETGRVDPDSVKDVCDSFVKEHPHLIESKSTVRLPGGAPKPPEKKPLSQMSKGERSGILKKALAAQMESDRAFKV